MNKAIILSINSGNSIIEDINTKEIYSAKLKGAIKGIQLYAGDYVQYSHDGSSCIIVDLFDRKNSTIRPKIANIDKLFIVQSIVEPTANISQMLKYYNFFKEQDITNIYFIITKTDICNNKDELLSEFKEKYMLNILDSNNNDDINNLKLMMSKGINCFVGQSGVGKSTLLNKLLPDLKLKTNEISKALNRGKHTTTTTSLYEYNDGYIVDTPGFSSVELSSNKNDIPKIFFNFDKYYTSCKFSNCTHTSETKCAIKEAIENKEITNEIYDEYLKQLNSLKK